MNEEKIKEIERIASELDKALKTHNSLDVNSNYNKLSDLLPDDIDLYKGWSTYLVNYYEDYIESEPSISEIFTNAIGKIFKARKYFSSSLLANLLIYEYNLIDTLTNFDPDFFQEYPGDYQLTLLSKIIRINPNSPEVYKKRGYIYHALGMKMEMEEDFQKVEELGATETNDYKLIELSNIDVFLNKDEEAIIKFEKLLSHTKLDNIKKICYQNLINLYSKIDDTINKNRYEELLENLE